MPYLQNLAKINSIVYKINLWYKANQISRNLQALKPTLHTQWNLYPTGIHFPKTKTTYHPPNS